MCGRFTLRATIAEITAYFDVMPSEPTEWQPRFNLAPTQTALGIRLENSRRKLVPLRWGLIPSWAKDAKIAASTINARADTAAEKPAFRAAFKKRRCLIAADGYYEWRKEDRGKIPYLFEPNDAPFFSLAGLWERWSDPADGSIRETCTIITTDANEFVSSVHHRMPVILDLPGANRWLDETTAFEELRALLAPCEASRLRVREVSTYVNSAAHEGAKCLSGE